MEIAHCLARRELGELWCLLHVETGIPAPLETVNYCVDFTVSIVEVVFSVGVIRGRMLTNLGQMSWTGHENYIYYFH